jgi:hypothetical protein
VWRWDPLGVATLVFAGGPALFGQRVVATAAERQIVDIGGVALGVGRAVVGFAPVARHVTAGVRTPAVLGVDVQVGYWLFLAPRSSRASAGVVALASRGPTPTVWAPVTSGSSGPRAAPSLPAIPSPPGGLTGIQKHRLLRLLAYWRGCKRE